MQVEWTDFSVRKIDKKLRFDRVKETTNRKNSNQTHDWQVNQKRTCASLATLGLCSKIISNIVLFFDLRIDQ